MGLRFRKSIKLGKHFSINLSPKGIGCSYGVKGARHSISPDGRHRTTYSVPGTGLTYTTSSSGKTSPSKKSHEIHTNIQPQNECKTAEQYCVLKWTYFISAILCIAASAVVLLINSYNIVIPSAFLIAGIIMLVVSNNARINEKHILQNQSSDDSATTDLHSSKNYFSAEHNQPLQSSKYTSPETYYINTKTKKIHRKGCHYAPSLSDPNSKIAYNDIGYLIDGYTWCKYCHTKK